MSSFVFNSFKERYLKGNVPSVDNWTFIPVSEDFKDKLDKNEIRLDQYKNLQDFKDVSDSLRTNDTDPSVFDYAFDENNNLIVSGTGLVEGQSVEYQWRKVLSDEDLTNKPMFITKDNYEDFNRSYNDNIKDKQNIQSYLENGGFYFLRSKDELEWFANRANENNTIIGVLGDNIEGDIEVPICTDESKPFEGVLDGNNYTIDINIVARNSDNGLIGILGKGGIVRNFKLKHTSSKINAINCEVPITLNYIKTNGRDVNCGLLVGRNYGTIENIDASEQMDFTLSGFVPSVYSVTNKTDEVKWNETENIIRSKFDEKNENFFYLNSFCINSPGNICPYVGYFNEGKFSDDGLGVRIDVESTSNENYYANPNLGVTYSANVFELLPEMDFNVKEENDEITKVCYYPMGYFNNAVQLTGCPTKDTNRLSLSAYIESPIYYGLDNFGYFTVRGVKKHYDVSTSTSSHAELFNSNIIQKTLGSAYRNNDNLNPSYENTRNSLRLHPQARAAYNVGVIAGANFGTISSVSVNATIKNTSNFVGFIGGLVGKQANGRIEQISVSSDFELDYNTKENETVDFTKGYHAYYKQTPILPGVCKTLLEGYKDKKVSNQNIESIEKVIDLYCLPWHENEETGAIDTKKEITNDVIDYNLRPIFVAGGVFGRYIPTIYNDNRTNADCILNKVNVNYKDNFATVQLQPCGKIPYSDHSNTRPENAFGIIAGKVDYATTTNNVYIKTSLNCENCNFVANSTVGRPVPYINNTWDETTKEFVPDTTTGPDNMLNLVSATSTARYVGIFEIKNNVLESISYNVNNQPSFKDNSALSADTAQHSLFSAGIFWACDYPFDLSSHNGGIIRTHNMFNYVNFANGNNLEKVQLYKEEELVEGEVNDFNHYFYNEPNYSVNTYDGGINKRYLASNLITFTDCYSNADGIMQLYDDYLSTYNYMKLPSKDICDNCADLDYGHITANTFTEKEIYLIKKYWNLYITNYTVKNSYNVDEEDTIKNYVHWTDDAPAYLNFNSNSALYMNGLFFSNGDYINQVNPLMLQGTQNTFDGYTTMYYNNSYGKYNASSDYVTGTDISSRNNFTYNAVSLARHFKKNIIDLINPNFSSIATQNTITPFTIDKETTTDDYFYYTYSAITTATENEVSSKFVPLTDAFGYTKQVEFKYSNTSATMGYCMNLSEEEQETKTSNDISIGEYNTPKIIRKKINDATNEGTVFSTSCVSSTNNLAGMLVVDSKYNNVMYLDLANPVQLTGNPVRFNTDPIYEDKIKMILKVQ